MKSIKMVTRAPWRAASASMASIWVLLPSTRAIQVRWCPGSRCRAPANPAATTVLMSSATDPVSHLPAAAGGRPWAGEPRQGPCPSGR